MTSYNTHVHTGPYGIKKPLTDSSHVASASNQLSVNKIVLKKNRRKPRKSEFPYYQKNNNKIKINSSIFFLF